MTQKIPGDISLILSYQLKKAATTMATVAALAAPPAHLTAQGPLPGIPMDSALEVVRQLELMNLIACKLVENWPSYSGLRPYKQKTLGVLVGHSKKWNNRKPKKRFIVKETKQSENRSSRGIEVQPIV
uniref:Uncharacterized protein n=1 Tax=Romanomermis culicivorax TaxID=13658 RepID=A0A915LA01_ROMCU